jgi:glycosyltransferase involved in cell wall biosynthesis
LSTPAITHVLYLSEKPGQNPFSGAENHVMTLLDGLAARGVDVELVVLLWHPGPRIDARLAALRAAGVRIVFVPRPATSWLGRYGCALSVWKGLWSVLRLRRDRIIHLHLDLVAAPIAARLAGCRRIVITVHNDEQFYSRPGWRFWLKRLARRTSAFIAITQHVADYFAPRAGLRPDEISVIRYGVPCPSPVENPRGRLGLPEDAFVVGFVGRLVPQKEVATLLRALADVPEAVGVIIGEGPEAGALEELATLLGISRRVRFMGAMPDAAGLMPAFDVFCLPSRWEGLGLVLVEAMLQSVPVVASRSGAIPEVMDQGRDSWLCTPGHPEEFARAIREVQAGRNAARARAERAREYAARRFDIPLMLDLTLAVYGRAGS